MRTEGNYDEVATAYGGILLPSPKKAERLSIPIYLPFLNWINHQLLAIVGKQQKSGAVVIFFRDNPK